MELTLSLDTGMVCGKCGRELNKDAVIYYSDRAVTFIAVNAAKENTHILRVEG